MFVRWLRPRSNENITDVRLNLTCFCRISPCFIQYPCGCYRSVSSVPCGRKDTTMDTVSGASSICERVWVTSCSDLWSHLSYILVPLLERIHVEHPCNMQVLTLTASVLLIERLAQQSFPLPAIEQYTIPATQTQWRPSGSSSIPIPASMISSLCSWPSAPRQKR